MSKLLTTNALLMLNYSANFVKILEICKDFAGNRVMNSEICPDGTVVSYYSATSSLNGARRPD